MIPFSISYLFFSRFQISYSTSSVFASAEPHSSSSNKYAYTYTICPSHVMIHPQQPRGETSLPFFITLSSWETASNITAVWNNIFEVVLSSSESDDVP